ncbi:Homeodomain-containing protein [Artemisia annua]|uniref:Homeodomain-containing protein n=1 Tax=Artemisia annua TaxID=35608 RepID=A0A2U1PW34_ARTAN|nr:Homeodomain-containing protein [Artemisia annua]
MATVSFYLFEETRPPESYVTEKGCIIVHSISNNMTLHVALTHKVLEVLKKMFRGEFKDHPRGTLQLNAMRIAEIFADDINFQSYVALN